MEALQSDSPSVFTLQSSEINDNWHWIEPFLRRIEDPGWDALDVRRELLNGKAQLWGMADPIPTAIWITRIENSYSRRWGLLWIAAGDSLAEGLELYREHTEPWLMSQGCEFVEVAGRKGWAKVLPDYEQSAVVLVKRFKDEQIVKSTNHDHH